MHKQSLCIYNMVPLTPPTLEESDDGRLFALGIFQHKFVGVVLLVLLRIANIRVISSVCLAASLRIIPSAC